MRTFPIPKTPLLDGSGRLMPEWLSWFNRISTAGDSVIVADLPTLTALSELLATVPGAVQVLPDEFPQVQQPPCLHDHAFDGMRPDVVAAIDSKLNELELWSL